MVAKAQTAEAPAPAERRVLRGVIFDMDGTLTVPNHDFAEMYRRVGCKTRDILTEIESWPEDERTAEVCGTTWQDAYAAAHARQLASASPRLAVFSAAGNGVRGVPAITPRPAETAQRVPPPDTMRSMSLCLPKCAVKRKARAAAQKKARAAAQSHTSLVRADLVSRWRVVHSLTCRLCRSAVRAQNRPEDLMDRCVPQLGRVVCIKT